MEIKNEMGVIVKFAQVAHEAEIEILSIQAEFPDATILKGGQKYRAEFESRNFFCHKHDIRQCDIVICWKDNCPNLILPVIELSNSDWCNIKIVLPTEQEKELFYWKHRAKTAEDALESIRKDSEVSLFARAKAEEQLLAARIACPHCGDMQKNQNGLNAHVGRYCKVKMANGKG